MEQDQPQTPQLLSLVTPPGNAAERNAAFIHYYRGEIARMSSWRNRIDQTTNWAITVTAAMLSVALSAPNAHHGVLLFAMLLILLLLLIEARRYQFFDVYRDRVRLIERYYFSPMFTVRHDVDPAWADALGESLYLPRFATSRRQAMTRRLRRNYGWIFLILLLAWLLKVSSALLQPGVERADWRAPFLDVAASAQLGPIGGWAVLAGIAAFYLGLGWLLLQPTGEDALEGKVHV